MMPPSISGSYLRYLPLLICITEILYNFICNQVKKTYQGSLEQPRLKGLGKGAKIIVGKNADTDQM